MKTCVAVAASLCALLRTAGAALVVQRSSPTASHISEAGADQGAVPVTEKDIFCWAVQGPNDAYLIDMTRQRLKACGGYTILSNYSDKKNGVVQLYKGDMEAGKTPGGWANNTELFLQAWRYFAESSLPHEFTWFVKVDADTFFRPHVLPKVLSKFDPTEPVALIQDGRIRGALEVMSGSSFVQQNSHMLYTRLTEADYDPYIGGEDVWLGRAFEKAGFRTVEVTEGTECRNFLLTYYNLPERYKKFSDGPGLTKNLPPQILEMACHEAVEDSTNGACVSRDIIALHPVKERELYKQFEQLDEQCK